MKIRFSFFLQPRSNSIVNLCTQFHQLFKISFISFSLKNYSLVTKKLYISKYSLKYLPISGLFADHCFIISFIDLESFLRWGQLIDIISMTDRFFEYSKVFCCMTPSSISTCYKCFNFIMKFVFKRCKQSNSSSSFTVSKVCVMTYNKVIVNVFQVESDSVKPISCIRVILIQLIDCH